MKQSAFTLGETNKLYIDFESTCAPYEASNGKMYGAKYNSFSSFREGNTRIVPDENLISSVVDTVKDVLGDTTIHHHEYHEDFKQLYFYTWHGKEYMSYKEREETNMKTIIIDFYINDWIFVALCNKNGVYGHKEVHSVCKGLDGLKEYFIDKKDKIIENK